MAEWSIALVLKTSGSKGPVSSNLTVSANTKKGTLMQVEIRQFQDKKVLVLIPNSEESLLIDEALGNKPFDDDGTGPKVQGNVCLSDGYGQHYIRLEKS